MEQEAAEDLSLLKGEALVDRSGRVWLPYDLPHWGNVRGWSRLSARREVRHAARVPFRWRAPARDALHILNGIGVTLGDSIIGMNVLAWLKICKFRAAHSSVSKPTHRRMWSGCINSASHIVEPVHYLPRRWSRSRPMVDLSDFPIGHGSPASRWWTSSCAGWALHWTPCLRRRRPIVGCQS